MYKWQQLIFGSSKNSDPYRIEYMHIKYCKGMIVTLVRLSRRVANERERLNFWFPPLCYRLWDLFLDNKKMSVVLKGLQMKNREQMNNKIMHLSGNSTSSGEVLKLYRCNSTVLNFPS
nr:PREDICTED: uncharacterized protein LOC109044340 [Bemisia tabaci]